MFGLAIWDTRARRLLVARDRIGIKPLHYAAVGGRLYFGSILSRDYPVVLALSLAGAVATLGVTLAADVAYAAADPRVRDGTGP